MLTIGQINELLATAKKLRKEFNNLDEDEKSVDVTSYIKAKQAFLELHKALYELKSFRLVLDGKCVIEVGTAGALMESCTLYYATSPTAKATHEKVRLFMVQVILPPLGGI